MTGKGRTSDISYIDKYLLGRKKKRIKKKKSSVACDINKKKNRLALNIVHCTGGGGGRGREMQRNYFYKKNVSVDNSTITNNDGLNPACE